MTLYDQTKVPELENTFTLLYKEELPTKLGVRDDSLWFVETH